MRNSVKGGARLSLVVGSPPKLPAVHVQDGIVIGKVPARTCDGRIILMEAPSLDEQMQRRRNRQVAGLI